MPPDPSRLCNAWKTMRMLPMRQGGILKWRGVNCSQTARLIHHTYRVPEGKDQENTLRAIGGAELPVTGKAWGKLYREGSDKIRARVAGWCPLCTPACIQGCDGLDNPVGARGDITVQPTLTLYWDGGGGTCCAPEEGDLWGLTLHLCGDAGNCSPSEAVDGPWTEGPCVTNDCCSLDDGWQCTLMANWTASCTSEELEEVRCCQRGNSRCYTVGDEPLPMFLYGDVAAYCCWRINSETGEPECCHYIHVRLSGFALDPDNGDTVELHPETVPGCCTIAKQIIGEREWDTGFHFAGCSEISSVSPPSSEVVCGAFSQEVGLNNIGCPTSDCEGTTVTTEGAEE